MGALSDTDRPEGVADVEMAVFDTEVVLFHESASTVHRLNSVAGAVWLLCDGETSVGSMPDELGAMFGEDPSALTDGIQQALEQLGDEGLLVGVDPADRIRLEPVDDPAPDGSRILSAPPDL